MGVEKKLMSPAIAAAIALVGALILVAGSVWFDLSASPPLPLAVAILGRLPQLVPSIVGIYAVLVLLATTAGLIVALCRVRICLEHIPSLNRDVWNGAFARAGLSRLAMRLIHMVPAKSTAPLDRIVIDSPFESRAARYEIIRFYRDRLSRAQFSTALAALFAIGALGLAEGYGLVRPLATPIATMPVFAEVLGLMFLTACSGLAVGMVADLLVDTIAGLPLERLDIFLLQSIVGTLEPIVETLQGRQPDTGPVSSAPSIYPAAESLARSLTRGRRSFEKTMSQLSKSVDVVASASRVLAEQSQYPRDAGIEIKALSEFQSAVERLATIIEGLPPLVQSTLATERRETMIEPTLLSSPTTQADDLGGELRRLLHDLE